MTRLPVTADPSRSLSRSTLQETIGRTVGRMRTKGPAAFDSTLGARTQRRAEVVASFLLAALTVSGSLFFWPVFESADFLVPPLLGALLIALVTAFACDRLHAGLGESALCQLAVAVLCLPGLMRLPAATFGLPLPHALVALVDAVREGPARLLTSPLPARTGQELLVAPLVAAWLGFSIGWLCLRRARVGLSVVGPLLTLLVGLAFGPVNGDSLVWVSTSFLSVALVHVMWAQRLVPADERLVRVEPVSRTRALGGRVVPAALLAVVAGTAVLATSVAPGFASSDRFSLREYRRPPFDPRDLASPLAEVSKYLAPDKKEMVLFEARGDVLPARWRLATLTAYDGRVWTVGNGAEPNGGEFRLTGARLAASDDYAGRARAKATVTIRAMREPWLPTPGSAVSVAFPRTSDELRRTALYNSLTSTLVAPAPVGEGSQYTIGWAEPVAPNAEQLASAVFGADLGGLPVSRSTQRLARRADELIGTATEPWARVEALRRELSAGRWSVTARPGHTYGDLARLVKDGGLQGNDEHYAALLGVLARLAHMPARVVVGFVPRAAEKHRQVVRGGDVSAWVEVDLGPLGWVPVPLEIDRSKKPDVTSRGSKARDAERDEPPNVVPKPDPELDAPEQLKPPVPSTPPKPASSSMRSVVVRVGVASSPVVLLTLGAVVIVAAKSLRRRRRRRRGTPAQIAAAAWRELLDRAVEAGAVFAPTATLAEMAASLPFAGAHADDVRAMLALTERAAYHPLGATEPLAKALWERVDVLSAALRRSSTRVEQCRRALSLRPYRMRVVW